MFPSPVALGNGASVTFSNVGVGPCHNGHMGYIPDGTYSLKDGILLIASGKFGRKSDIETIFWLAFNASKKGQDEQKSALAEITPLLPDESRAALQNLASSNPLVAILAILFLVTTIASQAGDAYRAFFPTSPTPSTVINNYNTTIINEAVPADERKNGEAKTLKREQKRRLRQMRRKKEKLENKQKI
ncbi:hypothetical protein [Roseibium polysiphoniae]|uniref:Uncharacterized protein n=1 Tax=Roseibium polysiphoniae TaxID=2571221 RepID=A0ABR9C9M8_9HYPH|nr:hypothetical protein [Roseibium polysiphoniae]MBD8875617.1 hypothetical protein [Roseibium polysiphoniae]